MADPADYLADGYEVFEAHAWLAVVPLATSLLAVDDLLRVIANRGFYVDVSVPFPVPVVDLWTFVNPPQASIEVRTSLLVTVALAVASSVLTAGLLASVRDALVGRDPAFVDGIRRYLLPLLGYQVLVALVVFAAMVAVATSPPSILLVVVGSLVGGYLFFGAPYLVVADERGLVEGLARSYRLALDGGTYLWFAAGFLLGGMVVSVVATLVVVNLGLPGILFGSLAAAPLGVVLTGATMAMILDQGVGGPG